MAKNHASARLPALPACVFAEREYLLAAWSRYLKREVVESLNVVAFGLWEDAPDELLRGTVRMLWRADRRVRKDVLVPRHLVERTQLFMTTVGENLQADLEGKDSIRPFGPLTTGPVVVSKHTVRTERVDALYPNYVPEPVQRGRRRPRRG